ncbi:MAG TPA: hypothetical protein VEZ16_08935 [Microvirga sp.]|nr:hypothetical protein [Microvirga sp.]
MTLPETVREAADLADVAALNEVAAYLALDDVTPGLPALGGTGDRLHRLGRQCRAAHGGAGFPPRARRVGSEDSFVRRHRPLDGRQAS